MAWEAFVGEQPGHLHIAWTGNHAIHTFVQNLGNFSL